METKRIRRACSSSRQLFDDLVGAVEECLLNVGLDARYLVGAAHHALGLAKLIEVSLKEAEGDDDVLVLYVAAVVHAPPSFGPRGAFVTTCPSGAEVVVGAELEST